MKSYLSLHFLQHHFALCAILLVKISQLFCDCTITQCLWTKLQLNVKDNITLLSLTPQAAIIGFLEANCQSHLIQSGILLISKMYLYKSRKSKFLSSTRLLKEISKINNRKKLHLYTKKKHDI